MAADPLVPLIAALADVAGRPDAAARLARQLGAAALFVFVPHPDVPTKRLPAPGFAATVPSRRGWQALLDRCAEPGVYASEVAYPTATTTAPAAAYAFAGVTIVLAGAAPDPELHPRLDAVAPLLAALLGAETTLMAARGDLAVARISAERAVSLTGALDLARGEAERAARVKDEFLAMLGHELRNPLAPIVTALQMLRLDGINTRAQDILERQVAHVLRLVDDLLDVSRITRGKVELRRERTELAPVIGRALEIARPLLEQRRNRLVLEVPERGLTVNGDPARLAQVFSNLLTNAAKYSGPETEIRVIAERVDAAVRVTVEDHGIGLEPAFLDRVFEQFVQVPQGSDRGVGGLGLGLAIVRSLVERHDGTVHAYSDGIGRGSRFVVQLPACASEPAISAPEVAASSLPHQTLLTAQRVLVVDDNPDAAELLGEVLVSYGYQVRVANSGPAALEALATFEPRAALLDLGLPVMDGYELARNLRRHHPTIRLIALTGYGQPGDRARSKAAGFDAHLVKPVSIASVADLLERLLG